jgi:hypothetical protein
MFLINQRLIYQGEIVTAVAGENLSAATRQANSKTQQWVFSPARGYPLYVSIDNLKVLPGGQL